MTRLTNQIAYDKKVAELRGLVELEAKKLQNIIESKDNALREILALGERKSELLKTSRVLEVQIAEQQQTLTDLIDQQSQAVVSTKQELNKEKSSLREAQKTAENLKLQIENLDSVANELNEFLKLEADARIKYLKQKEKLDSSEKKYHEIEIKTKTAKRDIETEKKELDISKAYLTDLYGRLATYVQVAKETIQYANEYFEEHKVPIHFKVPTEEILELDLYNFDKEHG